MILLAQAASETAARMGYNWAAVLAFFVFAVLMVFGALFLGRFLRPHLPTPEKSTIYECGERPIGRAWFQFNPRFYMVALVFVIFEVEIAFMVPVATVYRSWAQGVSGVAMQQVEQVRDGAFRAEVEKGVAASAALASAKETEAQALATARANGSTDADRPSPWVAFVELFVFVAILAAGLVYVWVMRDLEWVRQLREQKKRVAAASVAAPPPAPAAEPAQPSAA